MRKLAIASLCILLAGSLGLAAHAASSVAAPKAADSAAEKAIRSAERGFVAAWNVHDAHRMAKFWDVDGDLINPAGRVAKGRAEVEKLMTEEQSTVFKTSTYTLDSETIRLLSPTVAVSDWESTVTGMTGPDGKPAPPFKHHVTAVMHEVGGEWMVVAARPVAYPPPTAPANAAH